MGTELREASFARLLDRLDPDRQRAGEKYEDLRRTLVRFFEWRGTPFAEDRSDETLDRVARRIAEGIDVVHVAAYCHRVAQLVVLEAAKSDRHRTSVDDAPLVAPDEDGEAARVKEQRLACLDRCLDTLPDDSRRLLVEYYGDGDGGRIVVRRRIAERLGINGDALANRAQRLRNKLERCVGDCLRQDRGPFAT